MPPPNLTQLETVDKGNEEGGGEGGGRTVRIRDIKGGRIWLANSSTLATIS